MNEQTSMNRRSFVKTAAAGAAATTLAGPILAYAGGSDRLKIGFVGCGGRGTGAALQAMRAHPGNVLWAMGDIFRERVDASHAGLRAELAGLDEDAGGGTAWRDRLQVTEDRKFVGFDAYKAVIDSGVDGILLTTWPYFRPVQMAAAVRAGLHVFAEKPVAVDAPGIRMCLEAAAEAKRRNLGMQVGFCWRYHEAMRAGFGRVLGGDIGRVSTVHTTYHAGTLPTRPRQDGWSDMEFQLRNWWHFNWLSGDHIVEQAIHSVDRMAWAMGDAVPERVTCLGGRQARFGPERGDVYDHFAAVYEYEDGRRAFHTCRQMDGCPNDNSDYVYGTRGSAYINGWTPNRIATRDLDGNQTWSFEGRAPDMYQQEHDELWASVRNGTPLNDAVRGCNSNMMAIMGRMAAYTGRVVTWEEAMNSQEKLGPESLAWDAAPPEPKVAIPGQTKFL
jgi:myo-inositol 2-dehydrogenase / D-chiro-inositol 1-dehydrogenase